MSIRTSRGHLQMSSVVQTTAQKLKIFNLLSSTAKEKQQILTSKNPEPAKTCHFALDLQK